MERKSEPGMEENKRDREHLSALIEILIINLHRCSYTIDTYTYTYIDIYKSNY